MSYTKYYCKSTKRHYWAIGRFACGVSLKRMKKIVNDFSKETGIQKEQININTVEHSRKHAGYWFVYAPEAKDQKPLDSSMVLNAVYAYLMQ